MTVELSSEGSPKFRLPPAPCETTRSEGVSPICWNRTSYRLPSLRFPSAGHLLSARAALLQPAARVHSSRRQLRSSGRQVRKACRVQEPQAAPMYGVVRTEER